MISRNTLADHSRWIHNLETISTSFHTLFIHWIINFIKRTVCRNLTIFSLWIINHFIGTPYLTFNWSCIIKLSTWTLMTLRNAFTCQIIKNLSTFTLDWAAYLHTYMNLSVIISKTTVAIVFTLLRLRVQSLMIFAVVFELRKSSWTAFILTW